MREGEEDLVREERERICLTRETTMKYEDNVRAMQSEDN